MGIGEQFEFEKTGRIEPENGAQLRPPFVSDAAMVRMVLPCRLIPDGMQVTKPTGTKLYTILDTVRIFVEGGQTQEIEKPPGTRFMTDGLGTFNVVAPDTPVAVTLNLAAAITFLGNVAAKEGK